MKQKTVLIGITSGIAAYKCLDLIKVLKQSDINVFVIMTAHATQMISPLEFEKVSGNKVSIELFEKDFDYKEILTSRKVEHIELADKADLMIIAPATANILAKIANGMADDFLTTTILATTAPTVFCPSMNVHMWSNPLVQENIEKLKLLGYQIIEPDSGMLACGYEGKGRLADIQKIKNEIINSLSVTDSLKDKHIIVTAGGTSEKIDAVRSITNRSSGKMGIALAEECFLRGANVLLLRSKNSVQPRYQIPEKNFVSADDLHQLVKEQTKNADVFFHTAAVADFSIENEQNEKIDSHKSFIMKLNPRPKILDEIKKINPAIKLIAFKAEYQLSEGELTKKAFKRLQESDADAIVANDIGKKDRGFEVDTNEVVVILKNGKQKSIPLASKREIAKQIIDYLLSAEVVL
jgi:phosphopantothenoylcysteine decarboxylase / phosphopantothenate---cysteine ligase